MTTTVETIQARPRRGIELALTVLALAIVIGAWVNVDLALRGDAPAELATVGGGLLALVTGLHLLLRWRAPYADPLLLPISTLLNGLDWENKTWGVESMCVGGGQGMAMVVERLS